MRYGDTQFTGENDDIESNLQIHHGQLSVLPQKQHALAELLAPQSLLQRLLRESLQDLGTRWKRELLDPAPGLHRDVPGREFPETETKIPIEGGRRARELTHEK